METVRELIEKARAAQKVINDYSQEQVDACVRAIGKVIYDNGEMLAKEAVKETGMGNVADKTAKCHNVPMAHWLYMKDKKSVGMIDYDPVNQIATYAKPMGVVACITPSTNPASTPAGNGMCAIKDRNAMIVGPHPGAKKVTVHAVNLMREALEKVGAPKDLIQVVEEPTLESSQELMAGCDVTVATGGPGMVRAAYSSGKPSFGVGQGNVQVIVDRECTEKFARMAKDTVANRIFDNGVPCTCEQCIIVPREDLDELVQAFEQERAYLIRSEENVENMRKKLFHEKPGGGYKINVGLVGKSAPELAGAFGFEVPETTKVLLAVVDDTAEKEVLCREKLMPVIALMPYDASFEDAVGMARDNLLVEGQGHSCCVYTDDEKHIDYCASMIPVSRLTVNMSSKVVGGSSVNAGFNPTISLGCGSWGGNSISENLTYKHLMNFTKVATEIKDARPMDPDEIWG